MSDHTEIQWSDATWNPTRGCSIVSDGCQHCYAMRQAHRFSGPGKAYEGLTRTTSRGPVWTGEVRTVPENLYQPLRWRKPRRIFVDSMSDLFHEAVSFPYIAAVFGIMAYARFRSAPNANALACANYVSKELGDSLNFSDPSTGKDVIPEDLGLLIAFAGDDDEWTYPPELDAAKEKA